MRLLLLILLLLVTSCERTVDIEQPGVCESYGVQELNQSQGEIASITSVYDSDMVQYCGHTGWVDRVHTGCVVPQRDQYGDPTGIVDVYYRKLDNCTKVHELCHVKHGKQHTPRYIHDVRVGHPRPSCPP